MPDPTDSPFAFLPTVGCRQCAELYAERNELAREVERLRAEVERLTNVARRGSAGQGAAGRGKARQF